MTQSYALWLALMELSHGCPRAWHFEALKTKLSLKRRLIRLMKLGKIKNNCIITKKMYEGLLALNY